MTFWGVEIKPGKPFHLLPFNDPTKRLHISKATVANGTCTTRSFVQCTIGDKSPVVICSLSPNNLGSSQINVQFQESEEVVFSVLGPISVHLSGYYIQCPTYGIEPLGQDIENPDDETSYSSNDKEDELEDSFINDGDPGIIPSSPEAEVTFERKKKKGIKTGCRRIKKKYMLIDTSSDEQGIVDPLQVVDNNSDDNLVISQLCKRTHEHGGTNVKEKVINDNLTPKRVSCTMVDVEATSAPPCSAKMTFENDTKLKEEEVLPEVVKPLMELYEDEGTIGVKQAVPALLDVEHKRTGTAKKTKKNSF